VGPSIYSDPTGYRWLGLGEEPKVLGFWLIRYGGVSRKWNGNLRIVKKDTLPFLYSPWLSGHLMPKRHVQNGRKRSLLSDQSVVLPPEVLMLLN
jgi:hypothetical protein